MKESLIKYAVTALLSVLTPELLKELMDKMLDFVEDKVLGSSSTVDDKLVLPICELIRSAFDIPDND